MIEKEKFLRKILIKKNLNSYGGLDNVINALMNGYRNSDLSANKYSKLSKYLCPGKPKGASLSNFILINNGVYYCNNCRLVKPLEDFRANSSRPLGVQVNCKLCQGRLTSQTQPHRQAKYRSSKINATPSWADLDKIAEIYRLCPESKVVDHVIPLQGDIVCGLHVEYNLQYLTPLENCKKSNKLR